MKIIYSNSSSAFM